MRARGEVPFTHLLEVPELDENCTYTLDGALEQISASMVDSEEAEVRATIDFHLLVHAPLLCENIREIQEAPLDYKELQELPGHCGLYCGKTGSAVGDCEKILYHGGKHLSHERDFRRSHPPRAENPGGKIGENRRNITDQN